MVFDKIKKTIASQLEVDEETITASTNIIEDLGADSLDIVELITVLEDEFNLVVTDESVHEFQTVGDIAQFIENLLD